MSQQKILWLAFGTLIVMGGIGYFLSPIVREVSIFNFLSGQFPLYKQIGVGCAIGLSIGILGWQIILLPYLKGVRAFYANIIGGIHLTFPQIIFISICAGVGEEFLFRGAIQPLLGIWITSIIFVFIHGYLNPRNLPLFIYGIFMTLSIALIGYLTEAVGILSSMAAHTVVDVVLLYKLTNTAE